jgi:hypothetical protein
MKPVRTLIHPALLMLVLVVLAQSAVAQDDPADHFITLTRLGVHWMPTFGPGGDSMSRPFWLDEGGDPGYGSVGLRETWYISRDCIPNTAPFFALYYPAQQDHMDSCTRSG